MPLKTKALLIFIAMLVVSLAAGGGAWNFFAVIGAIGTMGILIVMLVAPSEPSPAQRVAFQPQQNNDIKTSDTYRPVYPRYRLASVKGMEEVKDKFRQAHWEIQQFGESQLGIGEAAGRRVKARNGILLTGSPGNGKTMLAEAMAGEMGCKFLKIGYEDIVSKWIGQTTEQLNAVFDAAKASASPDAVVLFVDEVESLIRDRGSMANNTQECLQLTNAFLTFAADIHDRWQGIILIAATNHLDMLDPAAIREGRFDYKIEVPPPDKEARLYLLDAFLDSDISYDGETKDRIAKRWEGFSVVRIKTAVENACMNVREDGRTAIDFYDMMDAMRQAQGSYGDMTPESTQSLSDLTLAEDLRMQMLALSTRMSRIDEIEEQGGRVPKGVLFTGPAGTGKTVTAKALAKDSNWAYLVTAGNELLNNPDLIHDLVSKAGDLRPCIIFIDEADDILMERTENLHSKPAVNAMLTAMDGKTLPHDVMFIAATNNPDLIDAAALRGGRFTEKFDFAKAGEAEATTLTSLFMQNNSKAKYAENVTSEFLGKTLHNLAPADINAILENAVNTVAGLVVSGQRTSAIITRNDISDAMVRVKGYAPTQFTGESKDLEAILADLNTLTGLGNVKKRVISLAALARTQAIRRKADMPLAPLSLHMIFSGNPGTGKTTIARKVGEVLKATGLLRKGHVIECSRSDLVAGYVGQTALKTQKVIDSALDGVLFIDEAYTLNDGKNEMYRWGQEAIDTLLKQMEDYRERLCVIVAGYSEPMKEFVDSNPGLKSRFTNEVFFEDYSAEELAKIFNEVCQQSGFTVTPEAQEAVHAWASDRLAEGGNFGNAREIRTLFEKTLSAQAMRAMISQITEAEHLTVIEGNDVLAALGKEESRALPIRQLAKQELVQVQMASADEKETPKTCPQCQTEITEDARFCVGCGKAIA